MLVLAGVSKLPLGSVTGAHAPAGAASALGACETAETCTTARVRTTKARASRARRLSWALPTSRPRGGWVVVLRDRIEISISAHRVGGGRTHAF